MRRLLAACLFVFCLGLAGCGDSWAPPPSVPLRYKTEVERRVTLSALKRAWEERPEGTAEEYRLYERQLISRIGIFGRKSRRTESYLPACQLWLACVREHRERYDE